MSESNAQLARRGFDAMLCGDLNVIAEMLDPEVKWHGGDPSSGCQNRAEALEFMQNALARRGPDIELVDVVEAGDKVVVIMRPQDAGDQGEQRASPVANVTTFRDGKVVEMVAYPDPDEAMRAEETRTPKSVSPPAPKAGASTNFATPAASDVGDSRWGMVANMSRSQGSKLVVHARGLQNREPGFESRLPCSFGPVYG